MTSLFRSPRARLWGVALLLFGFALALRLMGLRWGLPTESRHYSFHPDELAVARAASMLDFFSGDFNPDFYNYPSLFIYLTYTVHGAGAALGSFAPSQPWQLLHDFIWSGRLISALLGAATAPVIFGLARAAVPARPRAAMVAGLAAALAPGLVQHSHFATVDVAATFFVSLSLLLATRALGGANAGRSLILSALCAGLAAATKYNAGLVLVAALCAAWQMRKEIPGAPLLWLKLPATAAAGFLLGCPGALLYFRDFWGDGQNMGFAFELLVHPKLGSGEIFQQTGNGWWYHATFNLPFTFTAPALILAVVGLVFAARRESRPYLPTLIFTGLFFLSLGLSNVRFMRYVFPLMPALCLGVGGLAVLPRYLSRFAAAACLGILAIGTADVTAPLVTEDPRDRAANYFRERADAEFPASNSPSIGLFERPWFWTPPYSPLDAPPESGPQGLEAALHGNSALQIVVLPDAAALRAAKPEFVSATEFEWRDKERLGDARWLEWDKELRAHYVGWFQPYHSEAFLSGPISGRAFVPHDYLYTHPRVIVWRRRD